MRTLYETDIIAWADQQATLLRAGRWSEMDVAHIAEEIAEEIAVHLRETPSLKTSLTDPN